MATASDGQPLREGLSLSNGNGVQLNERCLGGYRVIDDSRNYWSSFKHLSDGSVKAAHTAMASLANDGAAC